MINQDTVAFLNAQLIVSILSENCFEISFLLAFTAFLKYCIFTERR